MENKGIRYEFTAKPYIYSSSADMIDGHLFHFLMICHWK